MEQQVKKPFYKRWWFIALVIFVVLGAIGESNNKQTQTAQSPSQPIQKEQPKVVETPQTTTTTSKVDAQAEFTRLMGLSKQSGLVKSYEMTADTSLKIFVSNVWYSQEVQFKKDMIAKFSTLEQEIYGRHRLEVRDAYSNELLAEVTAFSGSLEVYK